MTFAPITVPPGVLKTESNYAAYGRWIDMDHVRFVGDKPEKLKGTIQLFTTTFTGVARAAEAWVAYSGLQQLVWGTACSLYIYQSGAMSDITPYRLDSTAIALTNPFDTSSGSTLVTVHDNAHGITAAGVIVNFSGFSAVGGITISGDYTVTSIVDVNTFRITHSVAASSTVTGGGGSGTAKYTLNCGTVSATYLRGWGVGTWGSGAGGWGGLASLASSPLSEPTNWSFGLYGEDLIINRLNDGIWLYDTSSGPATRPAVITNAPAQVRSIMVTQERYLFALGCTTIAGLFDPMTVRWPDIEDITNWTPASTNTSNQRKLQGGTRLIAGAAVAQGVAVVWSDSHAFVFQFTGSQRGLSTIYSSRAVGRDCGLIGQNAKTVANEVAYWMSQSDFYMFNGSVQRIPNSDDVKEWVLENLNREHQSKAFSFYSSDYTEVWFVFPGADSVEPSRYVAVRLDGYVWIHGTWDRSAAARYTSGETRPILFGSTDGKVYLHDADSSDNNGAALPFHIELAPTDMESGNVAVDIWGFVPDFQRQNGNLSLYVYGLDHPRDGIVMEDTVTIAETDRICDLRTAGRQFGMILSGSALGCDFAMGKWGLEIGESAAEQRVST